MPFVYPGIEIRFCSGNQSQIETLYGIAKVAVDPGGELCLYSPDNFNEPVKVYGRGNWISFHKVPGKES